jgi:hypothetical protein
MFGASPAPGASKTENRTTVRSLKNFVRFLVAVQLLPALESGEETLVGGQAVLEGVMMRSPHAWAIACRKPSGEVITMSSMARNNYYGRRPCE